MSHRWGLLAAGIGAIVLIVGLGAWQLVRGPDGEGVDPASLIVPTGAALQTGSDAATGVAYEIDRSGRVRLTLTGSTVRSALGRPATLSCTTKSGAVREVSFTWPARTSTADTRLRDAWPARACTLRVGAISSRATLSAVPVEPAPSQIDSPSVGERRPPRPSTASGGGGNTR